MHIISGLYKGRKILAPKGLKTRPTSGRLREALFNICQGEVEGAAFLDLFAGSGAMGLEAYSRGARMTTFVDNSRESIRCIQGNLQALDLEKTSKVIYGDVFEVLADLVRRGNGYDLIYADPPYESYVNIEKSSLSYSARLVQLIDRYTGSEQALLKLGGSLFIEDAANAVPQDQAEVKHLELRSSRLMGRSALQHWIRKVG